MSKCFGLISIAFRRAYIKNGTEKLNTDLENQKERDISEKWITSPYCQIEPSMAFQIGIPILIFRETEVIDEGILGKGVIPYYMPVFDLSKPIDEYFESSAWMDLIQQWKYKVLEHKTKKQFEEDDIIKHIISCSICLGKKIPSDELYKMFNNTIDKDQTNCDGQRWNSYPHFRDMLKSYLRVDEIELEKTYYTKYHSLESDYITTCGNFFY